MKSRSALLTAVIAAQFSHAQFSPNIKNVIVIIQENRSPDNLFHFLTPACPLPVNADPLDACIPKVAANCYDISPCGLSNESGKPVPVKLRPQPMDSGRDPAHNHVAFEWMCDPDPATFACRNDGAWRILTNNFSYSYVENTPVTNIDGSKGHLLDPYLTMVRQYGWANFMYQTNQGASYAAHQFLFTGTSALTAKDDARSTFVSENFNLLAHISSAGCMALQDSSNMILSPVVGTATPGCFISDDRSVQECLTYNTGLTFPTDPVGTFCAKHQTLTDLLEAKNITWKYYAPTAGSIWSAPDAIQSICEPKFSDPNDPNSDVTCAGKKWNTHVDIDNIGTDILRDIASCSLARVNWVTPNATWSDHAGNIGGTDGPSWVTAIVNAVGNNPVCPKGTQGAGERYWHDTVILVLWDDWGGWSDNQPAPYAGKLPCTSYDCPADYQFGFRVPFFVVSAFTPAGYISNTPHDFGSILRMIEGINHIPEGALGFADKRADNDLHYFFTLPAPRKFKTIPAEKDAGFFLKLTGPAGAPDDD